MTPTLKEAIARERKAAFDECIQIVMDEERWHLDTQFLVEGLVEARDKETQ